MKRLIVRSNEWYDNLKEPKRTVFFLIFVMGTLIIAQYFMVIESNPFWFIGWATLLTMWRCGYIFIQMFNKNK